MQKGRYCVGRAAVAGSQGSGGGCPVNPRVPHVARVYDYWLGGEDNFSANQVAGEETIAAFPGIRLSARANRAFLGQDGPLPRGARRGSVDYLNIGTGLPTANNTHRWPRRSRRKARSSTSTTTRWCWPTPARC